LESSTATITAINPIRRVVSMLQKLQKQVEHDGKRDEEIFEKFMCYCNHGIPTLEKSIADATERIPQLKSDVTQSYNLIKQLKLELAQHRKYLEEAETALATATALRNKEAASFAKESGEAKTNLDTITKAIDALERGMGNFLQTSAANTLRRLTIDMEIDADDRDILALFLGQKHGNKYEPQSGQIVGILKQMRDTMMKSYKEMLASEDAALSSFAEIESAKNKELTEVSEAKQDRLERQGEASTRIQRLMEELEDMKTNLKEDKQFLADLQKNCGTREEEYAEVKKTRNLELLALADTIKMLNDDDALELFKKTIKPQHEALLQLKVGSKQMQKQALKLLHHARDSKGVKDSRLDFLGLAIVCKKYNFDQAISMIDKLLKLLLQEQKDEDVSKEYCNEKLHQTDDKIKDSERNMARMTKRGKVTGNSLGTVKDEIADLESKIAELDEQVTEATKLRKEEYERFLKDVNDISAASKLLSMAENRLNKFYNPALYRPPKEDQPTEGGHVHGAMLAQESGMTELQSAPPPPPTAVGAHQKKMNETHHVVELMKELKTGLDKESEQIHVEMEEAQAEYESFLEDAELKRLQHTKLLAQKQEAKADFEEGLMKNDRKYKSASKEAYAAMKVMENLHTECDFLLSNYDMRKEARSDEIEALTQAKQVLLGDDLTFVQVMKGAHFIRGVRLIRSDGPGQ